MLEWRAARAVDPDAELPRMILHEVGYPSSVAVGSSLDLQRQLLAAFFGALESRRGGFSRIIVHQLHDFDAGTCDALLADRGLASDDPFGAYMCSTGLRDSLGEGKTVWPVFLQAAATLATP
jgi:hypothetical protein